MRPVGYARTRAGAMLAIALLAAACGGDPEAQKREFVVNGDAAMAAGKYAEAVVDYRSAIQLDARSGEARHKLAGAYIKVGDGVNALREAVRAADLLPNDVEAQLQAANLLILAGQFADAKARAEKVLAQDPQNVRATIALGNALAALKDLDGAVAQLEEAIRLDPARAGSYTNLATLQLGAGRMKEAEAAYLAAVAKAPNFAAPHLALAQFYWLTSRRSEAEAQFLTALAADPKGELVNRFVAAFYQATGQPAKAEQHFRTAVEANGTTRAQLTLAEYYLGESRLADASAVLQRLTTDREVGASAKVRLAMIEHSRGATEAAGKVIDEVLTSEPRHVQALLVKASILFDQNRYEDALARTDAAVEADRGSAPAHFARGKVLAAMLRAHDSQEAFNEVLRLNPRAAGAQVELSKLHLQTGSADSAVALAGEALKSEPQRADARLILARGLILRREFIQAEAILKGLSEALPDKAVVRAQLGLLHLAKNDKANARREFESALSLDPLQLDAITGLVALDLGSRRTAEALARLEALMATSPRHIGIQLLAGRTFLMIGRLDDAERALRRVLEVDAKALDAYSFLGQVYLQQRRIDEARQQFEALAKREERPIASLTFVGLIHQMQNHPADARKVFEQVLAIDPRAPVAANNLAWIHAESGGNLDVALQLAQTAQASLPDSAEISNTLGWIYLKKDLIPLAVKELRVAAERDPVNATFQYHLGLAYHRSGDTEKARRALQTALKLKPDFDGSADASRLLRSL